ncbi:MAG TPA: hypothetical protein VLT59_01505 [Steroidobacteraceae bacterium]|nr:hypothetical protein [Steroidobacteraceae bacterium]
MSALLTVAVALPPASSADEGQAATPEAFYQRLVTVDRSQALRDLDVPDDIVALLAKPDVPAAVSKLEALAQQGDVDANVALVRTQHWCAGLARSGGATNDQREPALREALPPEELPAALAVLRAEQAFIAEANASCAAARFAFRQIEQRLRAAAAAGDAVSSSELARFTRDAAQREAFLEAAAEGGYAPAQYQLAVNRLFAVQRGQTTEKVETIRLLLKQAGQSMPAAKVDLANCMATGCDGHPADSATAAAFAVDAARDGEPSAYVGMLRMPWRASLDPSEIAAWQIFAARLNDAGCTGTRYLETGIALARVNAQFAAALKPEQLERAQSLADRYWTQFSERAKREQRCE